MNYTPHRCDPANFECTGGGDNPHLCEVDSVCQGACKTCGQYPTDSAILSKVRHDHYMYGIDPCREKDVYYRDKSKESKKECSCSSFDLFTKGHRAVCSKK